MRLDDYNALKEMLSEFRQEAEEIETEFLSDRERVREIDARLKVFKEAEPEDFKVFSPITMETMHREEIERIRKEKSFYESHDRELSGKKEFLDRYIEKLEKIVKCRRKDIIQGKETAEELHDASIRELEELADRIEQGSAQIARNPIQARQDFAVISRCLKDTADKIRDTVWII